MINRLLLQLQQPFYGSLDFVRDYPGKPGKIRKVKLIWIYSSNR